MRRHHWRSEVSTTELTLRQAATAITMGGMQGADSWSSCNVAVLNQLIAEDITSRFLNVVSLFNGTIPLSAIQSASADGVWDEEACRAKQIEVLSHGIDISFGVVRLLHEISE